MQSEAPEATEPQPPYLRWVVIDGANPAAGAVQAPTTITVQGPRNVAAAPDAEEAVQWAGSLTSTVEDNYGQEGYTGLDRDPRVGWYLVEQLVDDTTAAPHEVQVGETYRVRPAIVPTGFAFGEEADWTVFGAQATAQDPEATVPLTVPAPEAAQMSLMGIEDLEFGVLAAPPGAEPTGVYHSDFDSSDPTTWYSSGDPAEATQLDSFTSTFTQNAQGNWVLGATWTRPAATGTKGWTIEYTVAPERWGAFQGTKLVPQPERAQGGSVLFIENSNQQNYVTQFCTYTGKTASGGYLGLSCTTLPTSVLTSPNGGFTMVLSYQLPSSLVGQQGCPSTLGSTGYIRSWTGNQNIQAWVAPVTVDPPSNCGKIVVNKRVLAGSTSYLEGATFTLHRDGASPGVKITDPWATCIIGPSPATSCTITLPQAEAGNRFWVVEQTPQVGSPAEATFALGAIAVGPASGNLNAPSPYPGRTPVVNSGAPPVQMPVAGTGQTGSIGETTNALYNPVPQATCVGGLRIGLVLDRSTSIEQGTERTNYGNAVYNLITGLITPANDIKITPIMFNSGATVGSEAIASTALATSLRNTLQGNTGWVAATNWQAALNAAALGSYDIVLMVTDGAPTLSGSTNASDANDVRVHHVERAVLAANAVKAGGAPVWAVGVALPNNASTNLMAISGTVQGTDWFGTNWDGLSAELTQIAQRLTCQVQITITKELVDTSGGNPVADNGWTVSATPSAVTPVGSGTLTPAATSQVTGSGSNPTGQANWVLGFNTLNATASVTIAENVASKPGWAFYGGTCTIAHAGGVPSTVITLVSTSTVLTGIIPTDNISCVFQNTPSDAKLKVTKVWVVNGESYADGSQPAVAGSAALTLSPLPVGVTTPAFGTTYTYTTGNSVTVNETYTPGSALCTLDSKTVTSVNGTAKDPALALPYTHLMTTSPDPNTVVITNTVTCLTQLTLLKEVDKTNVPTSTLQPSDWKLTAANGPTKVLDGVTGATAPSVANTASVTAGTAYALTEVSANGQLAYTQLGIQKCQTVVGNGPSATCSAWEPGYITGNEVTVALGQHGIYRFVNQPIPPITVPLTGGMSADLFGIWGTGLAILAAFAAVAYTRRIRRQMEVR